MVYQLHIEPYEYYSNADISNVTVERGELSLGMHSGMKGDLLQVNGAGAVFSATGLVTGEIGSARFSEAWLSAGKISSTFPRRMVATKSYSTGR